MFNYEDLIYKIKDLNPIESIVGEYVKLKKSGSSYKGLCPFHSEKTPSFFVNPQKGFFHCFGCGKGGDVITFIQYIENVDFNDALEILARKSGINIKDFLMNKERGVASIIFETNLFAMEIFKKSLFKNRNALEYLYGRGLVNDDLESFSLGYADGEKTLLRSIKEERLNIEDFIKAGLVQKSEDGRVREVFYNRIIFPIFSLTGNIIGFGGRTLKDETPKYVNTQQTAVYTKGNFLYGLNFSKKNIVEENFCFLVEGYMDFISLYKSGIKNVVAQLGTACTENQAKILKKFCEKVVIMYDSDEAGQNATMRTIPILLKNGLIVEIYHNEKFKDPDDLTKNFKKISFDMLKKDLKDIVDFSSFYFNRKDGDKLLAQKHLLTYIKSSVESIEDDSVRFLYQDLIRKKIGFLIHSKKSETQNENQVNGLKSSIYIDVISIMMNDRSLCKTFCSEMDESDFLDLNLRGIFVSLCNSVDEDYNKNIDLIFKKDIINNLKNILIARMDYYSHKAPDEKKVREILSIIKRKKIEKKIREIENKIKNSTDDEEKDRLLEIKVLLQKKIKGGKFYD